ncbi:hypothetical protein N9V27_00225 [bacterium]|jgi:hypothetical protein|nr:hypothetical protein [bacterium]
MPAKKKASAVHKVNIHEIMNAIDYRNGNYYTDLDDESKKSVSTYMAQRWASQVQGSQEIQEHYLLMVNDLSNIDYIATTSGHEELRYRVLALIGLGQKLRHEFVPPKGAKKDKLREWLLELLPHCNDDEVELFREINDSSVLQDIATAKNTSDKKLKDLFK